METPLRGWIAILLLALAWGLGPAVPALLRGDLLGHPYTDLYPAVWGLHAFATHQPGLPAWTESLCWPTGMGFYYSSPIHGWLATPLLPLLGLRNTWNVLIVGARIATVLLTYHWLRAEGARPWGALAGAGLYGCAACFHGFAVEGIVEGTDAWTLPLWGWCVARRRPLASIAAFFLVILSSWYLGAGGLVVALFWGGERRLAIGSALIGSILALPLWFTFQGAFPAAAPLSEAVREAMGAVIRIPAPGWAPGLHPFAKTSYIGWLAVVLFGVGARHRPWLAAGAMTCWILSLGRGPWYDLPGLAMVRFPYRFVAGSLFLAAPIVARVIDRIGNTPRFSRFGAWAWLVAPALVLEAWLAAPVEPVIPGASPLVPAAYAHVRPGALLEIPGPVAMPPGVINRSRPRARYLLYYQAAAHGNPSPWCPDFNGVAPPMESPTLAGVRALDPLELSTTSLDVAALRALGMTQIMIHRDELGTERSATLLSLLLREGGRVIVDLQDEILVDLEPT